MFTGSLAVVDQDITLFGDTIANNIKMWDKSIEDFEVIMAARDARLHEDIMQREGDILTASARTAGIFGRTASAYGDCESACPGSHDHHSG